MRVLTICAFVLFFPFFTSAAQAADSYRFVSEYVRELDAVERIRASAEQELTEKNGNIFANCIRSATSYELK